MGGIGNIFGGEDKQILSTGNSEIDKKIADGLPLRSLTLIEGENDTGKSVLPADYMGRNETGIKCQSLFYRDDCEKLPFTDGIDES